MSKPYTNLAISYASKNESIKRFVNNLTSVCNFSENSPKRLKYFECFLEFYKVELNKAERYHRTRKTR